jgi:hypothetical protein
MARPSRPDHQEGVTMYDRIYIEAYLAALARLHRPQWSWARLRMACRCGSELPCRQLVRLPR